MMKWGRKKPSSSSSSLSSSKFHVFPISWLSKLKQKGGNSEPKPRKENPKGKGKSISQSSPFGEKGFEGEKRREGLKSVWYDPDDHELKLPISITQNYKSVGRELGEREDNLKFNEMVSEIRKMKGEKGREGKEFRMERKRAVESHKWGQTCQRDLEEKKRELDSESDKADVNSIQTEEKDVFELQPMKIIQTIEENCEGSTWERQKLLVCRSEKQRKSKKQSGKVRVSSPRTVEVKIKALEEMKKVKLKKKKEREVEETTEFDNFAVVKSSFDPQQDFRDSMVEMIMEKGIRRPEELEELLVCYLTLNSDEYHDIIIKVFRQVWFDLNKGYFGHELHHEHCLYV